MEDKGDKYVRISTLAPFLFGQFDLSDRWLDLLKVSGLLIKWRGEELEQLSDKELTMVDVVEQCLNEVVQKLSNKRNPFTAVQLPRVFKMFDESERQKYTYSGLLLEASKCDLFPKLFWTPFEKSNGSINDTQRFCFIYIMKLYYIHIQNSILIEDKELKMKEDLRKAEKWKSQANQDFSAGDYKNALDEYTRAIELCHYNHVLYANRAQTYLKLQKYREALSDARRAVALKPEFIKGLYRLAEAAMELRLFEMAEKANSDGLKYARRQSNSKDMEDNLKDQRKKIEVKKEKAAEYCSSSST